MSSPGPGTSTTRRPKGGDADDEEHGPGAAPLKIRINILSPGAIRTPMNLEKLTSRDEYERQLPKFVPSDRIGEPQNCGRTALWRASDDSDYVNGASL